MVSPFTNIRKTGFMRRGVIGGWNKEVKRNMVKEVADVMEVRIQLLVTTLVPQLSAAQL